MKNWGKRCACILMLLAVLILLPDISCSATNEAVSGTWGTLTWTLASDGLLTITGTGPMEPFQDENSMLAWHEYQSSIYSVIVEEGITSIGDFAFARLIGMTTIQLPSSITAVNAGAFAYCSSMTSAVIPDGTESIGMYAFYGCSNLRSVVLPNNVASIGFQGFYGCERLDFVALPEGMDAIEQNLFEGCSGLKSVRIPANVAFIGWQAFKNCTALKDVYYNNGAEIWETISIGPDNDALNAAARHYSSVTSGTWGDNLTWTLNENGLLTISGSGQMYNAVQLPKRGWNNCKNRITDVIIEAGVTSICQRAFESCNEIKSIFIPDSVSSVDSYAFRDCTKLLSLGPVGSGRSIEIEWQSEIPEGAFYGSKLKGVMIPEGITKIRHGAFGYCNNLNTVSIPESVTEIESDAIYGSSLTTVKYAGNVSQWLSIGASFSIPVTCSDGVACIKDGQSWSLNKDGLFHIFGSGEMVAGTSGTVEDSRSWFAYKDVIKTAIVGEGFTSVGYAAFLECGNLTSVSLPIGITSIESCAFQKCTSLTSVILPDSVTSIGGNAFFECEKLSSIVIPNAVDTIPTQAFYRCYKLNTIYLPARITSIAEEAFYHCGSLENVYFSDLQEKWNSINVRYGNSWLNNASLHCLHTITIENSINGSVIAAIDGDEVTQSMEGRAVSLLVTPAEGYFLGTLSVRQNGTEIPVTDSTFVMPNADVTDMK